MIQSHWLRTVYLSLLFVIGSCPTQGSGEDSKPAETKPATPAPTATPPASTAPAKPSPTADSKSGEENKPAAPAKTDELKPGHSTHGEVFNEGPRQKAYLMAGMPKIRFATSTKNEQAQKFFEQGIGQLHGFWYFEAERSFRQAAALDHNMAMAYWGMAMANSENATRGKGFIIEANKRKNGVTDRERMYIDALHAFLNPNNDKSVEKPKDGDKAADKAGEKSKEKNKDRAEKYARDLEKILYKYPDDIEAKSFLALQLWKNRRAGIALNSYLAVDALLGEIFAADPMHPSHHYRIHLWDDEKADKATASAAVDGQTSPGIAHMWHMGGHIFSKLKRYDDAAWQQEASARVDHAHMMRDGVLPDRIHNFAHNNEWLIRDLSHIGRVRAAIDLAKNMTELPRHPKYNTLDKQGSAHYGRLRLFEVLSLYEQWDELIALCDTPYLEPTESEAEQLKRLRTLAIANFRKGDIEKGNVPLNEVRDRLKKKKDEQDKAGTDAEDKAKEAKKADKEIEKAKTDARKSHDAKIQELEKTIAEVEAHLAVAEGKPKDALTLFKKAGITTGGYIARVQLLAGDKADAEKTARNLASSKKFEVQAQAMLVEVLFGCDKKEDAKTAFNELREISGHVDSLELPAFKRLEPIAKEFGFPADWRIVKPPKSDIGKRPELDTLGPFRWSPSPAPTWSLVDADGKSHSSTELLGKPHVVMFYLGSGCLHCAEQLQAFGPKHKEFADAGISLLAISTDDQAGLKISLDNYKDGPMPIQLLSNANLETFKAFRCYDDFENKTLHGTFIIDARGLIRWHDISFEPFQDVTFVLKEAKRLLAQTSGQ